MLPTINNDSDANLTDVIGMRNFSQLTKLFRVTAFYKKKEEKEDLSYGSH